MHIYKHGFPASVPRQTAIEQASAAALALAAEDPTLDGSIISADILETDAHREAGEYLVRVVLGPDDRPVADPLEARRAELLAELAELEQRMTGTSA
ncbi:hypothetical protein Aph01nite_74090 [Acrocarpospora phusangensis]|uniref:Uncharacterized protein n=1 Tax=Acrocarpospora phusangensis TaxID=1070424 RepID=A0A919QHC9_9ACTN|nr:hypothetical protein [Acrocarpospora phusangensis]GIH29099.1 hypothetical protein Aph01nite_74090 [Acrocarpospora phusangensis]